jgi:hypothetical protein
LQAQVAKLLIGVPEHALHAREGVRQTKTEQLSVCQLIISNSSNRRAANN